MKQANNKTRNIALGLFILCTMGLSIPTFAGVKTGDPIELKFIGNKNNQPLFQLNLKNDDDSYYLISIKDESQNLLFSEKVKGINISRIYQFDISQDDYNSPSFELTFEVTSLDTHKTEVYKVSSKTKVTQNIIVAKL